MTEPSHAVFLSYASQDAKPAQRICEALRAAGIEVWLDQSELRGGDAWDQSIRKQIKACALFIPIISGNAHARVEGYFRLEWKLAVDRSHLIAPDQAFLLPVVVDDTPQDDERIPDRFRELQWTRLPGGETPATFVERIRRLLSPAHLDSRTTTPLATGSPAGTEPTANKAANAFWRSRSAVIVSVAAVIAAALASLAVNKLWIRKDVAAPPGMTPAAAESPAVTPGSAAGPAETSVTAIPEKSVAVLPFADMSEKHDQGYLADGLAEQLIDLFAKIPDLKVPARTSSFRFRGASEDISKVARELRVANVLEGSVRRAGNRLRVTAELIRSADGYNLWSETYDRDVHDVFKIQDDIASTIVNTLKATLVPLASATTPNVDAYTEFLIGRQHFDRDTDADFRLASKHFRRAIELDPNLGAAYPELAAAESAAAARSRETQNCENLIRYAERGVALAPQNGSVYAARGMFRSGCRLDWHGAEADFAKALQLSPGDSSVHRRYSYLLDQLGRVPEELAETERATALDPLSPLAWNVRGNELATAHQWQEARRAYERVLELNPATDDARIGLAQLDLVEGHPDQALAMVRQMRGDEEDQLALTAVAEHFLHNEQASSGALDELVRRFGQLDPYTVAQAYGWCGQTDGALRWLERAYDRRPTDLLSVKPDFSFPVFSGLRANPRFKTILHKMNLPE